MFAFIPVTATCLNILGITDVKTYQQPPGDGLDLTIGNSHLKGGENAYYLSIDEPLFQMDLTLTKTLPGFQFGNGRIDFYKDRSAEWNLSLDVPRADTSGTLTAEGKMFNLAGNGYHDHTWTNIKLPTFMEKWYSLRFFQGRYSIVLLQIYLTKKFGGGVLCAGLIDDGENLIPTRSFLYKPLKWRKESTSGLAIPTELQLRLKTDDYSITGTIKESRFLDSIDVLGQLA
jgi:predicted secreted hydrolase